jgi:hypothetical protein
VISVSLWNVDSVRVGRGSVERFGGVIKTSIISCGVILICFEVASRGDGPDTRISNFISEGYIQVWEWGDTGKGLEFRDTRFGDRGFGEY